MKKEGGGKKNHQSMGAQEAFQDHFGRHPSGNED